VLVQIEISKVYGFTEWRDDLRRCLMEAALQEKTIVFLFADTQVRVHVQVCVVRSRLKRRRACLRACAAGGV
jgi:hypothetical protein